MIIFLINSKIKSGHEKMFQLIYDNLTIKKKYLDLNINKFYPYYFNNKTFIVSAGYPLQNLTLIFLLKLFLKNVYVYTPFGFEISKFNVRFSFLKELLIKIVYFGSNVKIITCSYEQKELFQERFPNKSIFYLNNFTEHNIVHVPYDSILNNVFYIGRIDQKQKNCKLFLDLANYTPYHYNLIGKLDDISLKNYLNHEQISFHDLMSNPFEKVTKNSCLILPSFYEGAALVVIEACFHNIPIFLSNCVGNKHYADDAIIFNNPKELILILDKHFTKDPELNQKWMKFRMNVLNNYNKQVFLTQLTKLENLLQ